MKRKYLKIMLKNLREFRDLEPVSISVAPYYWGTSNREYEEIFKNPKEEGA
jgi:hypothetical protein